MLSAVVLDRRVRGGKFCDVIDVADVLAEGDLHTPANAIAVMCRQSSLFAETVAKLQQQQQCSKRKKVPA